MRETRDRQSELLGDIERLPDEPAEGAAAFLLQTFTESTYPTLAERVYACHPLVSDASDTEDDSPAISMDGSEIIYAANIGSKVPPDGTAVLGFAVGGRVVFRYDGPE